MTSSEAPARLPKFDVAGLDDDQRLLYEAITGGPRAAGPQAFALVDAAGRLEGPFNAMLLSPPIGSALQGLGAAVRYGGTLTDRCRELAILVVAHAWSSTFEIMAHQAVGAAIGLEQVTLDAVRDGRLESLVDPTERLVATTTHALVTRSDLTGPEFEFAQDLIGPRALFELVTLVGYYATLALQLRVFRVGTPLQADQA